MFTLAQIDALHDTLGNAETLLAYARALHEIGVETYDSYVVDGHSEYFGQHGHKVVSPPAHDAMTVALTSNRATFLEHLKRHEQGETDYFEMSQGLADSGIEKWTVDTRQMTMIFYDKAGAEMLVEQIT